MKDDRAGRERDKNVGLSESFGDFGEEKRGIREDLVKMMYGF